jgi:predicted Rdx family selenoprotein
MKNSSITHNSRVFIIVFVALLALAAIPLLSSARSRTNSISVNIVNNSNWEIRHVYLQASAQDAWSEDQLGGSVIAPSGSSSLTIACDGQTTKVISEDKDGCFLNKTVSCDGNTTWTIASDATPDCGNN